MSRPPDHEWSVLGESTDPVPGDPHEVRDESTRLGKMAATIRDQIRLLRDIAGDENVGRFADKLTDAATELRGDLKAVAERYEEVAGYLGHWAGDLDYAQSESLKALAKAQQAAPGAHRTVTDPSSDPHHKPTEEEQRQHTAAKKAKEAAQGDLEAAQRQVQAAKDYRDERGKHWMQKIEDSEHDGLKDSHWDDIKNFIHEHAGWIKVFADVCTWVATILVIASLFIPGLNIGAAILLPLLLAALLGHTALALSGDGSWLDVGMDVFAIATLGMGEVAAGGLESVTDIAEGTARGMEAGGEAEEIGTGVAKAGVDASSEAGDAADVVSKGLGTRVSEAFSSYSKGVWQAFKAGGDREAAEHIAKLRELADQFPDNILIKSAADVGQLHLNQLRVINTAANVADELGHWGGGVPDTGHFISNAFSGHISDEGHSWANPNVEAPGENPLDHAHGWNRLKELTTVEVGG